MKYEIKGHTVIVEESVETDGHYTEYNLFVEGELIGSVSKYNQDKRWTAWSEDAGEELGTRAEIKSAVGLVIKSWEN